MKFNSTEVHVDCRRRGKRKIFMNDFTNFIVMIKKKVIAMLHNSVIKIQWKVKRIYHPSHHDNGYFMQKWFVSVWN